MEHDCQSIDQSLPLAWRQMVPEFAQPQRRAEGILRQGWLLRARGGALGLGMLDLRCQIGSPRPKRGGAAS